MTTTQDPLDRIQERVEGIKNGDPAERVDDPGTSRQRQRAQRAPIPKGSTRAPGSRKQHPMPSPASARNDEGSTTVTKPKAASATKAAPKKAPAKKSVAAKSTTKPKPKASSNGSAVDMRNLPFDITWTPAGGEPHTYAGNWGNVRTHSKRYLEDEGKLSADEIKAGLADVAAKVRDGKGAKLGSVTYTVTK